MSNIKTKLIYNPGPPPRRGAWPVRSQSNTPHAGTGWRYWDGERWGQMCSSRAFCLHVKCIGRNTPLKWPVLWGKLDAPPPPPPRFSLQWQPLTTSLLATISANSDQLYWLAIRGHPKPEVGQYKWQQGPHPYGFETTGYGRVLATGVTHVMPFNTPSLP